MPYSCLIIIIIIIIPFMQGIYISETNWVPREYSVAAVLLLPFMVLISLVSVLNLLYLYTLLLLLLLLQNSDIRMPALSNSICGHLLTVNYRKWKDVWDQLDAKNYGLLLIR